MNEGKLVQYGTPLEIVTRPENEFIEELVGTGNMMRRLSLLSVQSVLDGPRQQLDLYNHPLAAAPRKPGPCRIHPHDDLRSALSLLLKSGADACRWYQPSGEMLGESHLPTCAPHWRPASQNNLRRKQEKAE